MNKNFLNISLTYGFGFVLLRGLSFFLLPLYTNLLNTSDAGILFIIYALLAFLNPVYTFGLDSALLKFFNFQQTSQKRTISSSLFPLIISSGFLSLIIFLISFLNIPFLGVNYNWLCFVAIILFFDSFSSRLIIVLRLLERPLYYLFVGLINIVGSLSLNVVFIYILDLGAVGAVYALVLVSFVQFLCLLPILIKYFNYNNFNYGVYKKMLFFGLPFFPAAILFIIMGAVDRWLIKYFLTLNHVGLYGAGYKVGSLISILVIAFNLNWQPYYLKNYNHPLFKENIKKISQVFTVFLLFFSTLISIGWEVMLKTNLFGYYLIGKDFWLGGLVIPWVAFGYFFYGLFVLQMPSIYICNKPTWSPVFWGTGALTNVILNILFIPNWGIVGAGIATFLSFLVMFLFILYKNQTWFPINFINTAIVMYSLLSIIIIAVHSLFFNKVLLLSLISMYFVLGCKILININDSFSEK